MRGAHVLVVLTVLACAGRIDAQGRPGATRESASTATTSEPTSLESHLSMVVAERLLASDSLEDQLRAIARLSSWGRREAIDRILRAFEVGAPLARDPRARLSAVRAVSALAARESVLKFLVKTMSDEVDAAPLAALAQQTAAMALAATQDPRAHEALIDAIDQSATVARVAEPALLAYPPASLGAIIKRPRLSARVCALLGKLGDLRALGALRGALAQPGAAPAAGEEGRAPSEDDQRAIRVAAAKALAQLGDEEQVPVARSWAGSDNVELRLAGVEVLLASHAKDAGRELAKLLRAPELRWRALALADRARDADLAPVLAEIAASPEPMAEMALASLGRLDRGAGVGALDRLMRDPGRGWGASYALASSPSVLATHVLAKALEVPATRRMAARAATVQRLASGDAPRNLVAELEALRRSSDPSDRATGAFGLALLGRFSAEELGTSRDLPVVRAVARASLVRGGELARACAARLARESDAPTRQSLSIVLALGSALAAPMSTTDLARWAGGDDPGAALAAYALGSREESSSPERMDALLASDDATVRAHAAWGLSESAAPTAAARLGRALRFEPEPSVRRALVQALSARAEAQKWPALREAAELDPDARARELARRALRARGRIPVGTLGAGCAGAASFASPCASVWIRVWAAPVATERSPSLGLGGERAATFRDASGLALPVVSDPDGALIVVGISPGVGSFDLASSALWYDAPPDDTAKPSGSRRPP